MIQATKPTFSFGVLLLIALGLVGAVYYLSQKMQNQEMMQLPDVPQHKNLVAAPLKTIEPAPPVSTDDWQVYTDTEHNVSFKYPQSWQVKTYNRTGYDIIVLTPDQGKDNVRIYVSTQDYIGLGGLETSKVTVGGQTGLSANNMVIGVKRGSTYFTFDAGQDQQLLPEFDGIIKTVAFKK